MFQLKVHDTWLRTNTSDEEQLEFLRGLMAKHAVSESLSKKYSDKYAELRRQLPLYQLVTHREVLHYRRAHNRRLLRVSGCGAPLGVAIAV